MTFPIIPASTVNSSYQISRSLRFRSSASAYLSRTPASATNQTTWTWSGWVKRGDLGRENYLFGATTDNYNVNWSICSFNPSNNLYVQGYASSSQYNVVTTAVFRDPSAWYHIVISFDTTQATNTNRIRLYVNGVLQSVSGTYPSQNLNTFINRTCNHTIGATSSLYTHDGYLAEVNFIDGQALTPSSFGAFDTNGVWQPARYTGSYGTNGFYLNFSDNSGATATTIGKDSSGNSNNWTPSGISVATGTTYDSMIDSPTNYADGGNGRGNYCVFNPLDAVHTGSANSISSGNLEASGVASVANLQARGGMAMPSGKYYAEFSINTINYSQYTSFGIVPANDTSTNGALYNQSTNVSYFANGNKRILGTNSAYGASWVANDIIGIAVDVDNTTVTFYKNGVSQGAITSSSFFAQGPCLFAVNSDDTGSPRCFANFGQRPFTYTPPSGFSALNTQNLPTPTIAAGNKYFNPVTYSGTGTTQSITGVGFSPDFVWIKTRSAVDSHALQDTIRGVQKYLASNTTAAEATQTNGLTSFDSDGFTLGGGNGWNGSSRTFVAWNWNAGGAPTTDNVAGAGNVPTAGSVKINGANSTSALAGSIAATRISANTSAGFSVVTYTGNGTAGATVGHGLGAIPSMIIVRNRVTAGSNWPVYHSSLNETKVIYLNLTNASSTTSTFWNNTAPTSAVFSVGTNTDVNESAKNLVAYCFAPVAGYSAFGSYTGNGLADGPMIFTGFRPRWIMIKIITVGGSAGYDWYIFDTARDIYNAADLKLVANSSVQENQNSGGASMAGYPIDILSNGFKIRNSGGNWNGSTYTYIYAAFAEHPFRNSRAR